MPGVTLVKTEACRRNIKGDGMEKEAGIILKTFFPKKRTMILLDRNLGKIECVPPCEQYRRGGLLEYDRVPWGSLYRLTDIKVIDMPLELGRGDIQLIHQILELCYFCAPFGSLMHGLFELLEQLYGYTPQESSHEGMRTAFIFKTVMLLGLHPDELHEHQQWIYDFSKEPLDTIAAQALHLEIKQQLQGWIAQSVRAHPLHVHFKTEIA